MHLIGLHLCDGVDSAQDLIDSGLKLIHAKTLFKRIEVWKANGVDVENTVETDVGNASSYAAADNSTPQAVITADKTDAEECSAPVPNTQDVAPKVSTLPTNYILQLEEDYATARFCSDTAAVRRIQQFALTGDPFALAFLSALHQNGCKSFPVSMDKALEYARMALPRLQLEADAGNAHALFRLAQFYSTGLVLEKNDVEAARLFQLGANLGHAPSQVGIGWCYMDGTGTPKYEEEGVRYFKLAAEAGNALAWISLASAYKYGAGTEKKEGEAAKIFQRWAKQGHCIAQHHLATCYLEGSGVDQDEMLAVRYFKQSAQQNYLDAIASLGYLHEVGRAVTRNEEQALKYYTTAAQQGHKYASDALKRIAAESIL